jgi:nuclear GTP-binding protein
LAQKAASKELKGLVLAAQGQAGDDDDEEEEDADEDEVEEGEDEEMDEEDKRLRRKIDREVDEDEYQENPGVLPLYGKKPVNPVGSASDKKRGKQAVSDDEDEEVDDDDEEIPELIDTELPTIQAALDKADVVVEVLDARDPIGFRSTFLENLVLATPNTAESTATPTKKGKKNATPAQPRWTKDKLIILLNKIDLVPRETAEAWLKFLRTSFLDHADRVKVVLFKASFVETPIKPGMTVYGLAKGEQAIPRTIPSGVPVGRDQLIQILNAWKGDKAKAKAATNEDEDEFNVVFLGQPNVGKSAVVNTLLGRPKLTTASTIPVSGVTGPTTTVPVEVVAEFEAGGEGQVRLIDTPGWEFNPPDVDDEEDEDEQMDGGEGDEDEDVKWAVLEEMVARDMLTRNIGRIDKVKDALPLGESVVLSAPDVLSSRWLMGLVPLTS